MKNYIHCSGLYSDVEQLQKLMSSMEFESQVFGNEIINFNYIPSGLEELFTHELNEQVEIQSNTGIFRKPYNIIHTELFYQHSLWVVVAALDDTTITIHEQDAVKTVFDASENLDIFIKDNCYDHNKWSIVNTIKLKRNDYVYIRPWLWYSLELDNLTQVFLLNVKQ